MCRDMSPKRQSKNIYLEWGQNRLDALHKRRGEGLVIRKDLKGIIKQALKWTPGDGKREMGRPKET